jgi:hypothetical protein
MRGAVPQILFSQEIKSKLLFLLTVNPIVVMMKSLFRGEKCQDLHELTA